MDSTISQNMTSNAGSNGSAMGSVTRPTQLDSAPAETTQQVTQFIDDSAVQIASLPKIVQPTQDVLEGGVETSSHNITDILNRPVEVASLTWDDTSAADTVLTTLNFPEDLFSNSPNLVDKINYFTFLRASVVIRFTVNANPFQAGRLIAYFAPFSSAAEIGDRTTSNNYLQARTAFPHIVLNASSGNSGELTIPYVSFFTHYNLPLQRGTLGTVQLAVLNPLQSGSCSITAFARFSDIQLEIPTAVASPESFSSDTRRMLRDLIKFSSKEDVDKILKRNLRKITAEAQVCDEGETKAAKGFISSTLDKVTGVATLGSNLPVVGKYLLPLSWLTKAASGVAAYFGYARPLALTEPRRVLQLPGYGFTNMDGVDTSVVMGSSVENAIAARGDLFGTGLDDMDIPSITKRSCYLNQYTWTTDQIPTTVLAEWVVTPGACVAEVGQDPPVYRNTLLSYVASIFQKWRGSIKYKIQVTKTPYHSGRLRITFIPGGLVGGTGYLVNQAYSEILDLRTSDEIEFDVKFTSETVWKNMLLCDLAGVSSEIPAQVNIVENGSSPGIVRVEVLNALRGPDTVSQTINFNVWVAGGSDLQFAIPTFSRYVPVGTFQAVSAEAQVLGAFQDPGYNANMQDAQQMFEAAPGRNLDAAATCIGEHVQSLRALTRRYGRIATFNNPDKFSMVCKSSFFGEALPTTGAIKDITPYSPMQYISWLYRFYRGSVRYKLVSSAKSSGLLECLSVPSTAADPFRPADGGNDDLLLQYLRSGAGFEHIQDNAANCVMEVVAPYYGSTHISLVRGLNPSLLPDTAGDTATSTYLISSAEGPHEVLQAAGDDFSFGWLVGPPRLVPRTVNPVASVELDLTTASTILVDGGIGKTGSIFLDPPPGIPDGLYSIVLVEVGTGMEPPAEFSIIAGTPPQTLEAEIPTLTTLEINSGIASVKYTSTRSVSQGNIDQAQTIASIQSLISITVTTSM